MRGAVCCIDPIALSRAARHLGDDIAFAPRRHVGFIHHAPALRNLARYTGAQVVHAWGVDAAAAAQAQLPALPLVISLPPTACRRTLARRIRALPRQPAIVVGSQSLRGKLIAAGLEPGSIVVIRGPVDFSAISKAREAGLRRAVVGDARPVVLFDGPPSSAGGQYYGIWAAAVVSKVLPGLRVIMPYDSRESRRLQRFVRQVAMPELLCVPDSSLTWPQLAACADVFCAPAVDDVPTESLAWAMAAGIPVVGSAVRSIAEIIADKHNGLLCKPREPRFLASKLLTAIEDHELRRRITEVARGQAYEVFSAREFADNHAALYDNLVAVRPAAEGIRDTAMVA